MENEPRLGIEATIEEVRASFLAKHPEFADKSSESHTVALYTEMGN